MPAPCSAALMRSQRWQRLGRRRPIIALPHSGTPVSQKKQYLGQRGPGAASCTCSAQQMFAEEQTDASAECRFCWETRGDIDHRSSAWRHEPITRPEKSEEQESHETPRKRANKAECASMAASVKTKMGTTSRKATPRKNRGVRFDRCVRVLLVPSRHDFDSATSHRVWWGRADHQEFRAAAELFFRKNGTLSVLSKEELEDVRKPQGMPLYMSG